jgi:hypothetical protein
MLPKIKMGAATSPETECLSCRGESVVRVEGLGLDLAENLSVHQLVCAEGFLGPESSRGIEDSLVEDVVVSEESIGATLLVS